MQVVKELARRKGTEIDAVEANEAYNATVADFDAAGQAMAAAYNARLVALMAYHEALDAVVKYG